MTHPTPRTVAYLRVSTSGQDVEKNTADILMLANRRDLGPVHFVEETVSGRVSWRRRQLAQVLDDLQAGDRLIVSELSRLGRSMLECMEILAIAAHKGIDLYAVKGEWQLDGTMQSTIMAMVFAMAAEIERELISQRTKEALRVKKAAGAKLGRPRGPGKSKLDPYQPEIEALLANGSTQKFIAKRYGTTEGNLYHWLRKRGLKRARSRAEFDYDLGIFRRTPLQDKIPSHASSLTLSVGFRSNDCHTPGIRVSAPSASWLSLKPLDSLPAVL